MVKYRHCHGEAVLKVTSDATVRTTCHEYIHAHEIRIMLSGILTKEVSCLPSQCISFKFDEATNMKKLETMNMLFFSGRTTHKNRA